SDCWAVGSVSPSCGASAALIEHLTPSGWLLTTSISAACGSFYGLSSVSCSSATDCWAVGTCFDHFTGGSWSGCSTTNLALQNVDCLSATNCWAVGSSYNGSGTQTQVYQYNGSAWSAVSSPDPIPFTTAVFKGIACTSASNCVAAGYYYNGTVNQ